MCKRFNLAAALFFILFLAGHSGEFQKAHQSKEGISDAILEAVSARHRCVHSARLWRN
jgi:hypothetical protein